MEYQEQSLGGQIFNRIRDDILSGNYTPGEELKEATLGKQLGVSRTPVREALRQLDLEGLVEIAPNRGAKVIGISRKDVEDIYHMQDWKVWRREKRQNKSKKKNWQNWKR